MSNYDNVHALLKKPSLPVELKEKIDGFIKAQEEYRNGIGDVIEGLKHMDNLSREIMEDYKKIQQATDRKNLERNQSLVSECCNVPFSKEEGRCQKCKEGCVGVEVCNGCSEDIDVCECDERCNDCGTWQTGACYYCKMD